MAKMTLVRSHYRREKGSVKTAPVSTKKQSYDLQRPIKRKAEMVKPEKKQS